MNDETPESAAGGEAAVYEDAGGEVRFDVRLDRETVWQTQRQMAEVFDSTVDNVGLHLRNVYSSGELEERATTEDFSVVQTEGRRKVRRRLKHYNLDAIISVGYRASDPGEWAETIEVMEQVSVNVVDRTPLPHP